MSNVTSPLLLPAYASSGAFEWASSALEGMRAGAQLITQSLTDFLPHDPGNMGGCVSTSQQQQHSRVDDEGYIVTDWKLHTTQHHDTQPFPVDTAHIITRNPAGVAFSQSSRDGAHLLSSWRGDGTPAGHSEKGQQAEEIPLQLAPTALMPGITPCLFPHVYNLSTRFRPLHLILGLLPLRPLLSCACMQVLFALLIRQSQR